ncbi:MAG: YbaB/EbfC family nucleoid-associated protein [Clostridiales Family XIII bacterium]|jgi:DNA-binding YbaB/EbfC family protein|nr:YbaB/EbfC family nucleoid-associated protein [Clostridiales Family XIII bacterium]
MGKGMKAGKRKKNKNSFGGSQKNQMKQFAALKSQMEERQNEIEAEEFETSVGGDAVKIKMNGKKEVLDLIIKDDLLNPDDKDMLTDLIISAVNEGIRKADEKLNSAMGEFSEGLSIPGL